MVTGSGSTLMHLAGSAPATVGFYRSVFAVPALGALAVAESRRHRPPARRPSQRRPALRGPVAPRPPLRWSALVAGACLAADLLLWQRSVLTLGAGLSSVVQNTQVLWVAAAGFLLFGERVPPRVLRVLPALVAGVAVIALGAEAGAPAGGARPLYGTLLAVASAVAYAGFIVALRVGAGPPERRCRSLLAVTVSCAAVSAAVGAASGAMQWDPGWAAAGWLALLAVTSQVLGWTVLMSALARIGALRASIVLLAQPVSAVAWAALVLGERPTGVQAAGTVVILVSVVSMTRGATAQPPMVSGDSCFRFWKKGKSPPGTSQHKQMSPGG